MCRRPPTTSTRLPVELASRTRDTVVVDRRDDVAQAVRVERRGEQFDGAIQARSGAGEADVAVEEIDTTRAHRFQFRPAGRRGGVDGGPRVAGTAAGRHQADHVRVDGGDVAPRAVDRPAAGEFDEAGQPAPRRPGGRQRVEARHRRRQGRAGAPAEADAGRDPGDAMARAGLMLRWLQATGAGKPIALVGGGTTRIGDPSGKDETRALRSVAEIDANKASIKTAFAKLLRFGEAPGDAIMVDNAEWLQDTLAGLGRKHVDYGVTEAMYPWVGAALLQTLEEIAGDAWTDELRDAWSEAYSTIAAMMLEGSRQAN